MEIVSVQFQSRSNKDEFSGREYSYFAMIPLQVGDIVKVPTAKGYGVAKVTKLDVQAYQVGCDLGLLKTIRQLASSDEEKPQDPKQDSGKREKGMRPLTLTDTADTVPA